MCKITTLVSGYLLMCIKVNDYFFLLARGFLAIFKKLHVYMTCTDKIVFVYSCRYILSINRQKLSRIVILDQEVL